MTWAPGAPVPPSTPARPPRIPIADLFEEALRLYGRNFLLLFGIGAIVQIPTVFVSLPMMGMQSDWARRMVENPPSAFRFDDFVPLFGLGMLSLLVGVLLGTFGGAAMVYVAGRAKAGDRPPPREVLQALRRLAPALFGLIGVYLLGSVLLVLAVIASAVLVIAVVAFLDPGAGILITVLVLLLGLAALFFVVARLALVLPVVVLEQRGALQALERSWVLVRGSTFRTLGIFVVVTIAVSLVAGIVTPFLFPAFAEGFLTGAMTSNLLYVLFLAAVGSLTGPILPILITLLYLDYSRGSAQVEGST